MYLIEFVEDNPVIKPSVKKGHRALLDQWRYEKYLKGGCIVLIQEIKIARPPIVESEHELRIKKAIENIKVLYPEGIDILEYIKKRCDLNGNKTTID